MRGLDRLALGVPNCVPTDSEGTLAPRGKYTSKRAIGLISLQSFAVCPAPGVGKSFRFSMARSATIVREN